MVLISYLALELLDLSLGHCVFDLELLRAEAGESETRREDGLIIKRMAAQPLCCRYGVSDRGNRPRPALDNILTPTLTFTHMG